jgi:hypothetical protein
MRRSVQRSSSFAPMVGSWTFDVRSSKFARRSPHPAKIALAGKAFLFADWIKPLPR